MNCPLCCNETFSTTASLKSHIMEILDNLLCPLCNEKFDKLSEFAEHLESDCVDVTEINSHLESDGEEVNDHTGEIGESILARALLEGNKPNQSEQVIETQYLCQSCNIYFTDIDTHLSKFHEGQEIILVEDETNGNVTSEEVSSCTIKEETSTATTPTKKVNTVTQQDIKDKDGRLYTRKFVKIDKFWLQENSKEPEKHVIEVTLCGSCNTLVPTNESHNCEQASPKKIHNCEVCNTTFSSFKSLRLHQRMHGPTKTREIEAPANYEEGYEAMREMFICKICHKTYDKEYEQIHMNSHESDNGFNCEICNRKFYTKSNLEMHIKAHSNNKKFTCSYCKKSFVTYDSLNEHLLNQCQKRPYACQYCGRRFTRPHEKVKHERIHTGEKPHVCEICGKSFRVSYCLTLHLRTHSGTRPYQCKHCGKRFKSHSVFNHHLLTHSDVRAYKCPYCPKAFKTSVQLAGHKNSHIKPFTCTECNRPFASLYAVRAHMETHKRDNNLKYECWICGALYSRAFALRDHLKQQHQQEEGKAKAEVVGVDEEMVAASSILVNEEDIILGLEGAASIEIIENEGE